MAKTVRPDDLRQIFFALQSEQFDAVIVGGQAVNLWAARFQDRIPELQQYLPFASEDLDFYGGRLEALSCHDILGGRITLSESFDPSPNSAVLLVDQQDKALRIDFLASVYGLNEAEIIGTAMNISGVGPLAGVQTKVLHPILCLASWWAREAISPAFYRQGERRDTWTCRVSQSQTAADNPLGISRIASARPAGHPHSYQLNTIQTRKPTCQDRPAPGTRETQPAGGGW